MNKLTYEQSVQWMRNQPELAETVKLCYLDIDNFEAANRFAHSEEFLEITRILKINKFKSAVKIMEIGCGNGIASFAFASQGHEVSAVDPDSNDEVGLGATERIAKRLKQGSISTFSAYAEKLPFETNTFDIVYARQALHHFYDLEYGIKEIFRVLKPGGIFFGTREHVINNAAQLDHFRAEHLLHKFHGGENAYQLCVYQTVLKKAGFKKIKYYGPMDNVINHFPLSNSDVQQRLNRYIEAKLGKFFSRIIGTNFLLLIIYRKYLSIRSQEPGRLYSFLCFKQ